MEYKRQYTEQELDELIQWFETHKYAQDLDYAPGEYIPDLQYCVEAFVLQIRDNREKIAYSGQVHKAFELREAIIRQGKVLNPDN